MQVPQLPASQQNGGASPARRALSSSVSPGFGVTDHSPAVQVDGDGGVHRSGQYRSQRPQIPVRAGQPS